MALNISYEVVRDRLQKLGALDLSTVPYADIKDLINTDIILPILVTEVRAGNHIERIRINKQDEIFTKKKELFYRTDLGNIKTFGRANSPGSSIFYGSVISSAIQLPRIVALAETDELLRSKDKGKIDQDLIMTVSKWEVKKNMRLAEMVFKKDRIASTPEIEKAYNFHLNAFRKNMPEEDVQMLISILEFYSEEFAKSEIISDTDYKISAAYAESAFEIGNVQGIIYPSVRTDYEGSNVALLPKTVDEHLQFEEALIIHVRIRGKKVFLDTLYRTGTVDAKAVNFGWHEVESAPQEIKDMFFST
jgi:RES domain